VFIACSIHTIGSMQHQIPTTSLGSHGEQMARAVSTCVHCGFCLSGCPTYRVLGEEMDSPRGRIVLMKQVLEGMLTPSDATPFVDRCLGCLACETACPSGVRYRELLVPYRSHTGRSSRSAYERAWHRALVATIESPSLFRRAMSIGRLVRNFARGLPSSLKPLIRLVPDRVPLADDLPALVQAQGGRRARVALLMGCAQRVLRPSINRSTLRVLAANGVEVVIPQEQRCCGALSLHSGLDDRASAAAAHNAKVFPRDVDAIVTNTAGCGSAMKEQSYPTTVRDVAEFLDALGIRAPMSLREPTSVAYHDACHLAHGQNIRAAPRRLLGSVTNLKVVEIADADICCGSAGLYNLEHPDTAQELGRRKADAIQRTGATVVATGNIGCITQLQAHLNEITVKHTVEVLDSAI
jgi:glycolate oxidase iron-sulfur subunit